MAGTPDRGGGPGRIRDLLANPQWVPDRKPERPAAYDRSGTPGCHAGAFGPYARRLLYRLPFVLLTAVPHGEDQHAVRRERRVGARLRSLGFYAWARLSPLRRCPAFRQTRLRPCRETRLYRLPL